jgi:hypothetical protein
VPRRSAPVPHRGPLAALVALLAAAGALGACSSSPSRPTADAAADRVVEWFQLSPDVRPCLVERFDASGTARGALADQGAWSPGQQGALADVLDACVDPDTFATALATSIGRSLPPSDAARADEQAGCVHGAVVALDDGDRRTLAVGLLALTVAQDDELGAARAELLNRIYDQCGVTVQTGGPDAGGTVPTTAGGGAGGP